MGIVDTLLKIAGKNNFEIDERIGTEYIIRLCWRYGWMIIRGKILSIGHSGISGDIFVGRKVKLYEKKRLKIGSKTKIHDGVKIDALSTENVCIGDHVVIGHDTVIECTGGLQNVGKGVKIGNRTTFGSDCFFGAAGGIEIGEDVVAGQFIRFHSENHNYDDLNALIKDQGVTHEGIKIGNNCWIGAGVVFLDGAELGDGCVVAANAVVTKKFRENVVIGGVPAKVLKMRGEK
ncbi:DapH/DapD/GlmU-related protein [Desulfosporosinus sp. FKA]|uniref:acyltransferase n=1 Tax=Desulfosporosinus sp. FKA TaxID=1969834 RepID=UPI000B498843|nr:DapH/DapD/GlmU-related protein [Desulfosporosinus sp. FKA]